MTSAHQIVQRLLSEGRMPSAADLATAIGNTVPHGDHFVLASPSLREDSKHADMAALEPLAAYARTRPGVVNVDPGVGYWTDGKEESGVVWLASGAQVPEAARDLRHRFNQKATLGFAEGDGPDAAHFARTSERDPDKIHDQLMRHGVEYKTVVPDRDGSTVIVVDPGAVLGNGVRSWAAETGAHVDTVMGTSHFEGGDERPYPEKIKLSRADASTWTAGLRHTDVPDEAGEGALRDYLDEHNDPRADLMRHPTMERSRWAALEKVRAELGARSGQSELVTTKPAVVYLPDSTKISREKLLRRGKLLPNRNLVGWVLSSRSSDPSLNGTSPKRFFAHMTDEEFENWINKFPSADRGRLKRDFNLKLSRADVSKWTGGLRGSQPNEAGEGAFADYLDEHNDPRADLVRYVSAGAKPRTIEAAHRIAEKAIGRKFYRGIFASHTLPDGTILYHQAYHRYPVREGPPDSVHVVGWALKGKENLWKGATRHFLAVMPHDELKSWLDKFPADERQEIADKFNSITNKWRLSLRESINKARKIGNWFVKTPKDSGSPHAEAAASDAFKLIGLPHIPVQERKGRVVSPWTEGLTSVSEKPAAVREHSHPERVAHLTFGEWLVNAGDRIGRNYQTHPTLGLIGNDYGHAFHPLTEHWPTHAADPKAPVESYKSLVQSPNKYAEYHPAETSLAGLLRHQGLDREAHRNLRVPPAAVSSALANEGHLLDLARRAAHGLPADEQEHSVSAMKARLDALRQHVTNRGPVTVGDLISLTEKIREAQRRRVPRPV